VRTPRIFVLLHGFTDLPEQFAVVGQQLFAAADNVYIPRLPRHGARRAPMRSLGRISAVELARFGDSCVTIASGLGDSKMPEQVLEVHRDVCAGWRCALKRAMTP